MLIVGGQENFGMWDIMSDSNVKRFYDTKNNVQHHDDTKNETNNKHQHFIMEQTFNYKKDEMIVIDKDENIDNFLDE